jgi:uncharacterized protein YjiS (DUF1127 family)
MGLISRIDLPDRSSREPSGALRRGLALFSLWRLHLVQRRQLGQLARDPHLLRDLGLTAEDGARELRKQFWRP